MVPADILKICDFGGTGHGFVSEAHRKGLRGLKETGTELR